jgi:hypothetical protein
MINVPNIMKEVSKKIKVKETTSSRKWPELYILWPAL